MDNFADGAAVARIGARTFARLPILPARRALIDEDRLCTTMLEMLNVEGIVLEPAGALAVDALKDMAEEIRGKTVVCVTSGGNFDFERLPEVKERAQRFSGVKKYFILRMPQRPGALRDFLERSGPRDDIARFEYLKKSARNFGSVLIGIETTRCANFIRSNPGSMMPDSSIATSPRRGACRVPDLSSCAPRRARRGTHPATRHSRC